MKQEEMKILENVEKEIREKEDYCFQQISFCRKHKFEMVTLLADACGVTKHKEEEDSEWTTNYQGTIEIKL